MSSEIDSLRTARISSKVETLNRHAGKIVLLVQWCGGWVIGNF